GLPSGGSVGYELFDTVDALGTTNFMQNVNLVRALEGELARTIKAIDGVQNARVHLVMPEREMFTRDMQEPTASVYIKMKSGRLTDGQVTAVQHLIAAAVPKLKPTNISIIDERGTLLSRSYQDDQQMQVAQQDESRAKLEKSLSQAIISMVESSLGPGKVRAEVRAEMEYDKVVTAEETYNPEGQVPRSTVTVDETNTQQEAEPDNVSVSNNLPDAKQNAGNNTSKSQSNEHRSEETTNYEVSKKTVNQVQENGHLKRLSVAVLVDGTYTTGADGKKTYAPLPDDTLTKINSLVKSAIGFDGDRGDLVDVVNMQFTNFDDLANGPEPWNFLGFTKEEVMRMAEGLGVAVVAVLVILLVVRPLVTRAFESMPTEDALMSGDSVAQLTGPGGVPMPMPSAGEDEEDLDELIDIDKVEGRVKASSLRKISDIVDKHPEEALAIVRTWLYQEA
ncbi:MAG: flagellar M-ring protein FliF, partial [Rhodospirillaceae bacterium]